MSDASASKIVYSIGLIISVREQKFHANFDLKNESSRERKLSGTKVSVILTDKQDKQDTALRCPRTNRSPTVIH